MDDQSDFHQINDFRQINMAKADFDAIYNEPDPRQYFRVLGGLDYVVPCLAAPVLRQLIAARGAAQANGVKLLDVGCSYGATSALLRYPLTLDMLRRRYMNPAVQALPSETLREFDRAYFQSWPAQPNLKIAGLDPSTNAVDYACEVGILDDGIAEEFETRDPSPRALAAMRDIDLVVSTGCVGYVTRSTFDRILSCNTRADVPWIASFVLRMFPYDEIAESLSRFGLVTEKFEGATFVQRRFFNAAEYEMMLATLESRGIDPAGLEEDGLLHAELYVSRPRELVESLPLGKLVSIVSGQRVRYGRRFHRIPGQGARQLLVS